MHNYSKKKKWKESVESITKNIAWVKPSIDFLFFFKITKKVHETTMKLCREFRMMYSRKTIMQLNLLVKKLKLSFFAKYYFHHWNVFYWYSLILMNVFGRKSEEYCMTVVNSLITTSITIFFRSKNTNPVKRIKDTLSDNLHSNFP